MVDGVELSFVFDFFFFLEVRFCVSSPSKESANVCGTLVVSVSHSAFALLSNAHRRSQILINCRSLSIWRSLSRACSRRNGDLVGVICFCWIVTWLGGDGLGEGRVEEVDWGGWWHGSSIKA